jgi:hypothetical protein
MKKLILVLSASIFAASFAGARGRGTAGASSGRGGFARPLAHPAFAQATRAGASSRMRFAAASSAKGRSAFTKTSKDAPGSPPAVPGYATPGAKILSLGQAPTYSNPGNGGTQSVDGGGFVAINPNLAVDVGRSPGITLGAPDRTQSSGAGSAGGSGGSSNGPAFNPSF